MDTDFIDLMKKKVEEEFKQSAQIAHLKEFLLENAMVLLTSREYRVYTCKIENIFIVRSYFNTKVHSILRISDCQGRGDYYSLTIVGVFKTSKSKN